MSSDSSKESPVVDSVAILEAVKYYGQNMVRNGQNEWVSRRAIIQKLEEDKDGTEPPADPIENVKQDPRKCQDCGNELDRGDCPVCDPWPDDDWDDD